MHIVDDILSCSCCGGGVRNNADENTVFGQEPYPFDYGYGMCRSCGGDNREPLPAKATDISESAFRKRIGWAMETFYDARIDMLLGSDGKPGKLNDANREKFVAMPYWKKCDLIARLVQKGAII
jgi:hypothetical protein